MVDYNTHYNSFVSMEETIEMTSPQSTKRLLNDYLQFDMLQVAKQQQSTQSEEKASQLTILKNSQQHSIFHPATLSLLQRNNPHTMSTLWDGTFLSLEDEIGTGTGAIEETPATPSSSGIVIELNTFSDLQAVLKGCGTLVQPPYSTTSLNSAFQKTNDGHAWLTTEEDLIHLSSSELSKNIPPAIRHNLESSQLMDVLMLRAVEHWCCIGFKVAPISVDLVKNWRRAPKSIVYCIASISLVTLMDKGHKKQHDQKRRQQLPNGNDCSSHSADDMYSRQVAMAFYEQARNKFNDIVFDDMQPFIIQSYFCLSYTSNLLRLYEQQRTWGSLASIALQQVTSSKMSAAKPIDELTLGCWFRWYYIDAWMCLTLNRECLLPDQVPWSTPEEIERLSVIPSDQQNLYAFANLTIYMRRYIRALHSGKLFASYQQKSQPSAYYYRITSELTHWYSQLPPYHSISELHLHLCYHSMRVVILYQFMTALTPPPEDIVIDCLHTNLELLQALQHLKELGCDQSTYHHVFFAIHNTAKRIFKYDHSPSIERLKPYAKEQLQINLMLLKSTPAYAHDVFKIKLYAQKIQDQFSKLDIHIPLNTITSTSLGEDANVKSNMFVFRFDKCSRKRGATDFSKQLLLPPSSRVIPSPFLPEADTNSTFETMLSLRTMRQNDDSKSGPLFVVFKHEQLRAKRLKRSLTKKKNATHKKRS
ncbi:hypothetical protein BDF20DRAFT_871002 [Mycotypha africana]|uniref:uncharacterized protein n=1 Tax=Mycotypha africana TaxID=64632 RepID=UPI0022FFEBE2|nr:uncharacterized protein BDF20DRAFT_871002 [Mycotypha africana]KAI8979678.1 hypothetical protein BDF20DRAFT_871002 [Mycotypha africana]